MLVFDTNGTPASAAAVLAEIRNLTTQPVRYVVNSHWHWDHWYGTEVYQRAFPDVQIIAHERHARDDGRARHRIQPAGSRVATAQLPEGARSNGSPPPNPPRLPRRSSRG